MAISFSAGVEDAIAHHRAHMGGNEVPRGSNSNPYGKAFGMDRQPYCAIAIYTTECIWGQSTGAMVKSASSSAIQGWLTRVGREVSTPQRGDNVHVYKNGNSVHIERVLSFSGGRLVCIGSNTGGGSVADGDGTYINDRTAWWNNRNKNKGWSIKSVTRPFHGVTLDDVRALQARAGLKQDGLIGPATLAAIKRIQAELGVTADGFPGPGTMAALGGKPAPAPAPTPAPAPAPAPKPVPSAPAFPLPRKGGSQDYYYGPPDGPVTSVSGRARNSAVPGDVVQGPGGRWYSKGLKAWQTQMLARGWKGIGEADGRFGDATEKVVRQFQDAKKLGTDGKIGPSTWSAAWTEPVS